MVKIAKGDKTKVVEAVLCDLCYQRKGRNAMIVHHLKFSTEQTLRDHLFRLYGKQGETDGWIDSRIVFYRFVHKYHFEAAKSKQIPLWMAYLDSHGVNIQNRGELIMKFREGVK